MAHPEIEQAVAYYKQGYTCAQSILASFVGRYGLTSDMAFRLGEPFGAGMSCTSGMCGSVTGAIMLLGLQYGGIRSDDNAARSYTYQRVHELVQRFSLLRSSIRCTDLLGYDLSDPRQLQVAWEKGLFMQLCPDLVRDAAQILYEMLDEAIPAMPATA